MDLFDIFSGQESWHTRRLLELAKTLTEEQLDRPLKNQMKIFPWDGPGPKSAPDSGSYGANQGSVGRGAHRRQHAVTGQCADGRSNSFGHAGASWTKRMQAFHGVLEDVRNRSAWEDTFVDALCEPPETFTFGGMFADVITFNAHRRMLAIDALQKLGAKVEGCGSPMEYVEHLACA